MPMEFYAVRFFNDHHERLDLCYSRPEANARAQILADEWGHDVLILETDEDEDGEEIGGIPNVAHPRASGIADLPVMEYDDGDS